VKTVGIEACWCERLAHSHYAAALWLVIESTTSWSLVWPSTITPSVNMAPSNTYHRGQHHMLSVGAHYFARDKVSVCLSQSYLKNHSSKLHHVFFEVFLLWGFLFLIALGITVLSNLTNNKSTTAPRRCKVAIEH